MTPSKARKNTSNRPRSKASTAAAAPSQPTTIEALRRAQTAARAKFGRPSKTAKAYKGHLARGRAFLKDVAAQRHEAGDGNVGDDDIDINILEKAFDNPPNRLSAYALELFLIQKCIVEGLKISTAHGIQAAFADLWVTMDGDNYAGDYFYDKRTDTVQGCPARSATIKTLIKTLAMKANAEGASATREHAEAMKLEDLDHIMAWSESQFPSEAVNNRIQTAAGRKLKAKHLVMRAFMSSGFTLWTRNFELCCVKARHIKRNCTGLAPYNASYFEIFLEHRKGWQSKAGSEGSLESNRYNIYKQDVPAMDMYTHLIRWLDVYEGFLGRPLLPDEYVFPFISPNGTIDPQREMTHDVIQRLITEFATGAGLPDVYTTHSFRRGGAQYRFIFAPFGKRWSLNIIRWWGGWAAGENVDTLMKYLIDSLYHREKSHMDMLSPTGPREADQSFNGDHVHLQPVSTSEFRIAHAQVMARPSPSCACGVSGIFSPSPAASVSASTSLPSTSSSITNTSLPCPPPSTSTNTCGSVSYQPPHSCDNTAMHNFPQPSALAAASVSPPPNHYWLPAGATSAHFASSNLNVIRSDAVPSTVGPSWSEESNLPHSTTIIPNLGRKKAGWRRALDQWNKPCPQTDRAMKDWPKKWFRGREKKALANLRSGRKTIADEYQTCGGNDAEFLKVYRYADDQTYTQILKSIRDRYGRHRESRKA